MGDMIFFILFIAETVDLKKKTSRCHNCNPSYGSCGGKMVMVGYTL